MIPKRHRKETIDANINQNKHSDENWSNIESPCIRIYKADQENVRLWYASIEKLFKFKPNLKKYQAYIIFYSKMSMDSNLDGLLMKN